MNVVIIEDELRTARALVNVLKELRPEISILAILTSVQAAIDYFKRETAVDLVFMDIQLSDGHSFDILEEVDISMPIIFCTAYNNFMAEAFSVNGIDYILKPFNKSAIAHALDKWFKLKRSFAGQQAAGEQKSSIINTGHRRSMLVFDKNCYRLLPYEEIASFQLVGGLPAIKTFSGQTIFTEQSLSAAMTIIPEDLFYRVNRQLIIQKGAILRIVPSSLRNLEIVLKLPQAEKVLINKNKKTEFMKWLREKIE